LLVSSVFAETAEIRRRGRSMVASLRSGRRSSNCVDGVQHGGAADRYRNQ
jgi:hypothetical protein